MLKLGRYMYQGSKFWQVAVGGNTPYNAEDMSIVSSLDEENVNRKRKTQEILIPNAMPSRIPDTKGVLKKRKTLI